MNDGAVLILLMLIIWQELSAQLYTTVALRKTIKYKAHPICCHPCKREFHISILRGNTSNMDRFSTLQGWLYERGTTVFMTLYINI